MSSEWRDIETAPRDGTVFLAFSQDLTGSGLPSFISTCGWHDEAGFCTDELREPTHWMPPPSPPETNDVG